MDWYYYVAWFAIASQLVFLWHCVRNYRYSFKKPDWPRRHRPPAVLIVPCKGIDATFDRNIAALFNLDYEDYRLWFVLGEESDPAYKRLCELKEEHQPTEKTLDVQIFVAGLAQNCGQKVHNLLYCCRKITDDIEVIAFADSDICVRADWLNQLVWPLRREKHGASTGYRWFIPEKTNLASLALSIINGKVAQLAGHSRFNLAWGGSMAIRKDTFDQVGLKKIWTNALSDDLSLTWAVKKAGKKIQFVPACLVASYESMTWPQLFEFARRQFVITRICAFGTWCFGLCSAAYSVLGLWGGAAMAIAAAISGHKYLALYTTVPLLFLTGQFIRAILRQTMVAKRLKEDSVSMKSAAATDILTCWLWSPLLLLFILSSAFGRTITWRGIRYKLLGPTRTTIIK